MDGKMRNEGIEFPKEVISAVEKYNLNRTKDRITLANKRLKKFYKNYLVTGKINSLIGKKIDFSYIDGLGPNLRRFLENIIVPKYRLIGYKIQPVEKKPGNPRIYIKATIQHASLVRPRSSYYEKACKLKHKNTHTAQINELLKQGKIQEGRIDFTKLPGFTHYLGNCGRSILEFDGNFILHDIVYKEGNKKLIKEATLSAKDAVSFEKNRVNKKETKANNWYPKADSVIEDKIARICWNDYGWQRPSGREGKSTNQKSYEYKVGYGHEEWLLDAEKLIDGYHYGYLQPVADAGLKYQGRVFNISLYSIAINKETSERWWIGKINNAQVVSSDESKKAYAHYKKKGWFQEMIEQIKSVKGDEKDFLNNAPIAFVNIKFKSQDWQLLDPPQRISNKDKIIPATYYVLLNKTKEPDLELPFGDDPDFTPGHTVRNEQRIAYYGQRKTEVDRFHSRMQDNVYKQLVKIHGNNNVRTERPIGIGLAVDLAVKDGTSEIFYEFKTSNSVRICIREALSQLLEYSYYPNKERAKKLIIVSQNPINKQAKNYLNKIRSQFNIPVCYKQYDTNKNCLEEIE